MGSSKFIFSKCFSFVGEPGAALVARGGVLFLGVDPAFKRIARGQASSSIILHPNSRLVVDGSFALLPGSTIIVGNGAELRIGNNSRIGKNNTVICNNRMVIGENFISSWGCSMIDWDGHSLQNLAGEKRKFKKRLEIGSNVSIQMNSVIPSGGIVEDGASIGPNVVLRKNIPSNSYVYQVSELKFKTGIKPCRD